MGWKDRIAIRLTRSTGLQVVPRRNGIPTLIRRPERLLKEPVFILSSVRSGSTLLRVILNGHSLLYAPHETHLAKLTAEFGDTYVERSMTALGWPQYELTHLLWDRVLDASLQRSGKSILVEKTPHHVFMWSRLARCWPDARFLFLLRSPAAIVDSWGRARPNQSGDEAVASVEKYVAAVESARRALPGHTIRYEDLVADPAGQIRAVCDFLGVAFEPQMIEYGRFDHGPLKAGLGDWTDRIRSGRIQAPRHTSGAVPLSATLRNISGTWGYLPDA